MTETAYTIGRTSAYNQALQKPGGTKKLGSEGEEDYEGGWVWKTPEQVARFRESLPLVMPTWDPRDFSVYPIELPTSWEVDVSADPIPSEFCQGGHYLLHDAQILPACKL